MKLTPLVRLAMTFDMELRIDRNGVFNNALREKIIERYEQCERNRDGTLRSLFILLVILLIILFGYNIQIPVLNVNSLSIPILREASTLSVAFTLMMSSIEFINVDAYNAIIRQFSLRDARVETGGEVLNDPEFIVAAETQFQMVLKLFRPKMNLWNFDIFESKVPFKAYCMVLGVMVAFAMLSILVFVVLSVAYSLRKTYVQYGNSILSDCYYFSVILVLLLAILIYAGAYTKFEFGPRAG